VGQEFFALVVVEVKHFGPYICATMVKADQECGTAERRSYGVRGAPRQRQMGSTVYAHQIKEFLYFMRYGSKPAGF